MKKYIVTGSTGHISSSIIQGLTEAGHQVSVITSTQERIPEIEKLGAKALTGSVQDAGFINRAFRSADAVYTMIPPIWKTSNWRQTQNEVAEIYTNAIKANNVPFVVNLSSIGAHVADGAGPINGLHDLEQMLNKTEGLHVKHLRPAYFFYNFLNQIELIKHAGIMGGNFGGEEKLFLVHTRDIAKAALEELLSLSFTGNSARYVIGDERSGSEIAEILGKKIGKELKWVIFSDEDQLNGLLQAGVPETHAKAFTEMGMGLRKGYIQEHARKNLPVLSSIKLEQYAVEFSRAFEMSHVIA